MRLELLLAVFAGACHVQAKAVFAHFMIGNTASYTDDTWRKDIQLAKEAHISGFALNMAHGETMNEGSLERAFNAARAENFRLIFSFDYAGRGPWPKETVIDYLKKYVSRPEYFKHVDGRPLVSTFEGPGNANDWVEIKKQVDIFFMPDWSSEGAKPAVELAGGVADGLFSWAAWPWGSQDMDTYGDASYHDYLGKKPYMMPVSPWFYTNMPGYNKNWLWRGDDMWYDRWLQVIFRQPEYVQIISWNDYGESHYIGPLYDHAMEAFEVGKAPFNYAIDKPHDAWRLTLPYWIDYYTSGTASLNQESLVAWYRTSSVLDCSDGGTTGNTASQLQIEFPPAVVMQDYVYFSAILASYAEATVTVGGTIYQPKWTRIQSEKDGGMGMYHGRVFLDRPGPVTVTISRERRTMASVTGPDYGPGSCHNGLTNWNPWVGGAVVPGSVRAVSSHSRPQQGCTQGTGAKGFTELCEFTCMYDYCPDACVCTGVGLPNEKPPEVHQDGYPARDRSENYSGLCSFACNLGYCPSEFCSPTKERIIVPTTSEFLPPACTGGTGLRDGRLDGLCSYSCNFGFCPLHACQCLKTGALIKPPGQNPGTTGKARGGLDDHKLCDFACSRDWCPEDVCEFVENGGGGGDPVDPEDRCDPNESSFSFDAPTRMGEYMDWYLMDPAYAATTNRQYITIVNLTPHEFKLTYSHANQMDHWDWDSIPPGKSRQNLAHYTETVDKNPIDSKGEAYYDIGNTGKKFVVRVTNNIPNTYTKRIIFDLTGMGKGQREYKAPEQKVPVTLVITGSDSYGFVTSLSHGPGNWMNAIKDAIAHRKVLELIVPGTHDSGMSKITGAILTGATESNTQTQGLNIYNQLRVGARWFDLRVSTVHEAVKCCENYEFWTTHLNDEMATLAIGRSGEKLDEVIDEVNQFTGENPGEIIFLEFRYLIGIRNVPSLGPLYWTNTMKDEFFDKLKKINNRCPDLPERHLENQIIGDLMARNDGKGCVLVLINTSHFKDISTPHISPGDGIYDSYAIDWFDSWPDKQETKDVAEFAINGWKKRNATQFHVTQWLSTPDFLTSTFSYSLQEIALLPTNPALYWRGVIDMKPYNYPNVIMVDYIGMVLRNEPQWNSLSAELYTLSIGLNLYMLSENCDMNKRRSPLLPSRKNSRRPSNPLVADFNGVIFANGTVWDNPPPDFHLGRDGFLQNGTVFSNGTGFRNSTALHRTVRNTHFNSTGF